MISTVSCQPCGCDPGISYHCSTYPNCAWGYNLQPRHPSPQEINDGYLAQPGPYSHEPSKKPVVPVRATILPIDGKERKRFPVASGVLDYFPDAIVMLARVSQQGNDQHNPGQPLHWDRSKSTDEADTLMRHFLQRGHLDTDGLPHSAKVAWRALAILQKEIEALRQL